LRIENCDFPDDLLYDLENNVWVKTVPNGCIRLGITSIHAALAGRLNQVKFKPIGTNLSRAQSVATVESIKYFGVVRTPVAGRLAAINPRLEHEPKIANNSPYEEGWFAEIEPDQTGHGLESLVVVKTAVDRIRSQIHELHVRCFTAYPDHVMWEIGVECAAVLVRLNELLERSKVNDIVHVVSDDPTAEIEMERWSDETGQQVLETRTEGKLRHFIVKKVR
jgi:glycine cleavage system H lipoate-binding protein/TusA-related sulfurtransferase